MLNNIINAVNINVAFRIIMICIVLDTILGSARALKEHKWNSTVGINGMIRKSAMIVCIITFIILDNIMHINFLGMIPEEILSVAHIESAGITEFFGILFILYEITSILKNMVLCGLPVPKVIKTKIEALLNNMTTELDKKEG